MSMDPKVAWALSHPERFPVEVTTASPAELMRVPGIGTVTARRIVAERRRATLRDLVDLRRIGVLTNRAGGFVTLGGRRVQRTLWTEQLSFWRPEEEVGVPKMVYEFSPGTFR